MENINTSIPELERALETTKLNDELIRPTVDEIVTNLVSKIDDEENTFDSKLAFSTLAKSIIYLTQMYCNNKEHFDSELQEANKVVTDNIMASLGAFANEEQENQKVIYNSDEVDYENFSIRRLMMISASIMEYTLWRLTLNEEIEKEKEKGANEEIVEETVTE